MVAAVCGSKGLWLKGSGGCGFKGSVAPGVCGSRGLCLQGSVAPGVCGSGGLVVCFGFVVSLFDIS